MRKSCMTTSMITLTWHVYIYIYIHQTFHFQESSRTVHEALEQTYASAPRL